jgi:hypothetical protein
MNNIIEYHRKAIRFYLQSEFRRSKEETEAGEKYPVDLKAIGADLAAKKDHLSKIMESVRNQRDNINLELQKIGIPLLSIRKENISIQNGLGYETTLGKLVKASGEVNIGILDVKQKINELRLWQIKRNARKTLLIISIIAGIVALILINLTIVSIIDKQRMSTKTAQQVLIENRTQQPLRETQTGQALILESQTQQVFLKTQTEQASYVSVRANLEWQETIFTIHTGDIVQFTQINPERNWTNDLARVNKYDANGQNIIDPNAILPTARLGALIGKIDECDTFIIGTKLKFTASCSGNLSLVMNDVSGSFDNNSGEIIVQIEINKSSNEQQVPTSSPTVNSSIPTSTPRPNQNVQTPYPTMDFSCPGALPIRVELGYLVRVVSTDGDKVNLRSSPSMDNNIIDAMTNGTKLRIIGEHVCANNSAFWKVQIFGTDETGWVREADDTMYFIEPIY